MRFAIIRKDENNKQTAVCMLSYNNEKDKDYFYSFLAKKQMEDLENKRYSVYDKADLGFDVAFFSSQAGIQDFLKENPEYENYECVQLAGKDEKQIGLAVYKNWDCVEKARKVKLIRPALYQQICEGDRQKFIINIENEGCKRNGELLKKIVDNIIAEIRQDAAICECLRTGENRKKENEISFHNWVDDTGREFNNITYRNGGQAFSVLFDSDFNLLTSKYNSKVFVSGHEWIPIEDISEPKDCLLMIWNKLPEMEFNQWLADMGENEKYMCLKEELSEKYPDIKVSGYSLLSQLGCGYFTVETGGLQMAVQIKDGQVDVCKYRNINENGKPTTKWIPECPDKNNILYALSLQMLYTGHIERAVPGKGEFGAKLSLMELLVDGVKGAYLKLTDENEKGVETLGLMAKLDEMLVQTNELKTQLATQSIIQMPIENDSEKTESKTSEEYAIKDAAASAER